MSDALVVDLVGMLRREGFDATANKLQDALTWGRSHISLTGSDAECLFRVLRDPPAGLVALRAALLLDLDDASGTVLSCTECACLSETASGWVAVIVEDPDDDCAEPRVVAYCPPCAARVLEYTPRSGVYT